MRRRMMLVAGLVMLTGCVSTKIVPLQEARMASLKGKTLTVLKREKPSFTAATAGKAAFGLIGATAMIAKGNSIVRENNIEDPARYIAEKLAGDLANAHSMTLVPAGGGCGRRARRADGELEFCLLPDGLEQLSRHLHR